MERDFSARSARVEPFLAMEIMERAFAMERAGTRVLHLEIGEPDFPPPAAAVEACIRALREGQTRYTDSRGLPELREAIAADYARRFGVELSPERVIVTNGTSPGMLLSFLLLVEEGDEVIIPTPHYPCYPNFVRSCGGTPVFVPTDPEQGYRVDVDALRGAVTPRTRAIVLGSPANPTGAVQSAQTLHGVAELGLPILSDEIYDGLLYDGAKVTSALETGSECFVLDGFSKRYAMTGFRLGWLVAPERAMRRLQALQQNLFISASRFVQHAGVAALAHGEETVRAMVQAYAGRRDRLVGGLRELGFRIPTLPAGAFYVFADARPLAGERGADSLRLAFDLLERAHVGVTPGVDFGEAGEGFLRFCYAASDDTIEEALTRLAEALAPPGGA
jgi:aspartate/methionine/tyrosine aminotransferase